MGRRTIIALLTLVVITVCGMTYWLARAPAQPQPEERASQIQSLDGPVTESVQSAAAPPDSASTATVARDTDDEQVDEARIAKTILINILLRDFFAEVGIAPRDVATFRALLGDPTSATFDALIERSERGDAEATVLLNKLDGELCAAFYGLSRQPTWREDARTQFERQAFEFERVLEPQDMQRFRLVTGSFLDMAGRLSQQCKDASTAMAAARLRLPTIADEGDAMALMALAGRSDARRESLIAMLHELPDDELIMASDVIGSTAHGCDAFEVRLGVLRDRAAQSPAVSAAFGQLLSSSCLQEQVAPEEALAHWRTGAYLGSSQSADAYLEALSSIDPATQRIEAFAIQSFYAKLNRLGCMGGEYFDILRQQNTERALTQGLHLSPYENDVALTRADELWEQHSRSAMAHQHCVR